MRLWTPTPASASLGRPSPQGGGIAIRHQQFHGKARPPSNNPQINRTHRRENPLEARRLQAIHALKQTGKEAAIVGHHRIVAVLEQFWLFDLDLLAEDAAAIDAAAEHPVDAAVAVIGAAIAVLAKGAAE